MRTHRTVIVNTSPLFYLHRAGCLNCLEKLYKEIVIPEAVSLELEEGRRIGEDVPVIKNYLWIKVRKVTIPAFIKIISDLGQGEYRAKTLKHQENG